MNIVLQIKTKNKPTRRYNNNLLILLLLTISLFVQPCAAQKIQAKPQSKSTSLEDDLAKEPEILPETSAAKPSEKEKPNQQTSNTNVYGYDQAFALKGLSFGGVMFNQNFSSSVALSVDGLDKRVVSNSSNFQFVGGVVRYSEFPYNKIGADLSLSAATSANHSNLGYKPITSVKAELNIGYAWQTISRSSVYFFTGFGYENVRGREIEYFVVPNGGTIQIGGGLNYSKTISLEGLFAISRHGVGQVYLDQVVTTAISQGFTNVSTNAAKSNITANMIVGRLMFHF